MDQLGADERKKIFDLMKDRELGGNMDWMYRGDKPNTEEYLMGKPVDKQITGEPSANDDDGGINSLFSERIKANVALDMQAKMREDPLFAIRRKEEDARRRLLENPVKMKQLQKLLEQQQKAKSKTEKKEKKKKKKKKRNKSSGDDSSNSEDDLVNKYLSILTHKQKSGTLEKSEKHRHSDDVQGSDRKEDRFQRDRRDTFSRNKYDQHDKLKHSEHKHHRGELPHKDRRKRHSSGDEDHAERKKQSLSPQQHIRQHKGSVEKHRHQQTAAREDSSDGEDMSQRVYGLIKSIRHQSSDVPSISRENTLKTHSSSSSASSRSRSRSPVKSSDKRQSPRQSHPSRASDKSKPAYCDQSASPVSRQKYGTAAKRHQPPLKHRMTAEEREKKLQEMTENAKWRDEQRSKNIQRYKEDEAKDSAESQKKANFLSSMMTDHVSKSSVEDRLKRNKYNIQRTRAALEKNFTQH